MKDDKQEATEKRSADRTQARAVGFTGDVCKTCGNFTMIRAGTCLTCTTCGATTGCS